MSRKLEEQGYTRVDVKPRTVKSQSGAEGRQVRYTWRRVVDRTNIG